MRTTLIVSMLTSVIGFAAASPGLAQMQAQQAMPGMAAPIDASPVQKLMQNMIPADSDSASTKDFKQAGMNMMRNMSVPYTGDADVDFRTHMMPHHQGAVDMAKIALKYAKDPDTKKMAQDIINDQDIQIAQMRDWLKKHGKAAEVR
jgi:uncharacterized protein (DUF305 family)